MKVIFHAVIEFNIWQYEKEKSSIYIRFGQKELGNWKIDIGPCDLVRFVARWVCNSIYYLYVFAIFGPANISKGRKA